MLENLEKKYANNLMSEKQYLERKKILKILQLIKSKMKFGKKFVKNVCGNFIQVYKKL